MRSQKNIFYNVKQVNNFCSERFSEFINSYAPLAIQCDLRTYRVVNCNFFKCFYRK